MDIPEIIEALSKGQATAAQQKDAGKLLVQVEQEFEALLRDFEQQKAMNKSLLERRNG